MNDLERIIRSYENSGLAKVERKIRELESKFNIQTNLAETQNVLSRIERVNQLNDPIRKFTTWLPSYLDEENIFQKIQRQATSFQESVEYIISETPENLYFLALHGWYINFNSEFKLAVELGDKIDKGSYGELDSFFLTHYKSNLEIIFSQLKSRHPKRIQILDEIKESYCKGLYSVCIPTIFSQIDGVCKDVISEGFFDKINGQKKFKHLSEYKHLPVIIEKLEYVKDGLLKAFLFPIYNNTPAIAHHTTLKNFVIKLNRHSIMHGEDTGYGSEINCLKCISLLIYISDVLECIQFETE